MYIIAKTQTAIKFIPLIFVFFNSFSIDIGSTRQFDLAVVLIWIFIIKGALQIMNMPKLIPTMAKITESGKKFIFFPFFAYAE